MNKRQRKKAAAKQFPMYGYRRRERRAVEEFINGTIRALHTTFDRTRVEAIRAANEFRTMVDAMEVWPRTEEDRRDLHMRLDERAVMWPPHQHIIKADPV